MPAFAVLIPVTRSTPRPGVVQQDVLEAQERFKFPEVKKIAARVSEAKAEVEVEVEVEPVMEKTSCKG